MAPKQLKGPSSFCEWVVGTTIESAMGAKAKKPRRRSVVRVEISTDDESGEDTVRITYPRTSGEATSRTKAKKKIAAVKKVRFDEMPQKSALKKTTTFISSESDADTSEEEDSTTSCELSMESSDEESSGSSKSRRKKTRSSSENESGLHPTCKCKQCIRARQKAKKHGKAAKHRHIESSESENEEEGDVPEAKAQKTSKKKKRQKESDSESEDASAKSEALEQPQKGDKQRQKQGKGAHAQSQGKKGKGRKTNNQDEQALNDPVERNKTENSQLDSSRRNKQKQSNFPEALPGPHPRRPHYIEPVRAEVVQTEKVMETPQDPPPNAFYDAEHNIIRVYHGPVWGGNPNQSLYPRRDATIQPPPMGMPHPTQNPYFYGFKDGMPQNQALPTGYDNAAMGQGVPLNAWSAMCPPAGYPPMGAAPPIPDQQQAINGGAFNMAGSNGAASAPDHKAKDKLSDNNVGPAGSPKLGLDNPYYTAAKAKSAFSQENWGSNRSASQGSRKNDNRDWNAPTGGYKDDSWQPTIGGAFSNQGSNDGAWARGGQNDSSWKGNNGNGDSTWDTNKGNSGYYDTQKDGANDTWGAADNSGQNDWSNNQNNNWDNNNTSQSNHWNKNNQGNDWDNSNTGNNGTAQDSTWDNGGANSNNNDANNKLNHAEDSNVGPGTPSMPGSFEAGTPLWGDSSMAAQTGGRVNDDSPAGGW